MGQHKGCAKARGSGRKAGTLNRRSEFFGVADRLRELNYDLVGKLIEDIAMLEAPRDRVKVHLALLEYCDARRKSIELPLNDSDSKVPIVYFGVMKD